MLKTPLDAVHKKLGAQMTEFGGWEMPVYYTSLKEEHLNTRKNAGLFDICHMGEILISGKKAADFLQFMLTNNLDNLHVGRCFYSTMCLENGGVVDDLFCYKLSNEKFWLVVNAANIQKDFAHLKKYAQQFEVEVIDQSASFAKLDLQGPKAESILQKITKTDLSKIERFEFVSVYLSDTPSLISRTGYTGEDGFELYFNPIFAERIWNNLLNVGQDFGLLPVGLGARDTLRIEACYSLYGHELKENITPIEAGIGFVVKEKTSDFLGKKVLLAQKQKGAPRNLIAFEMVDKGIPREGYEVYMQTKVEAEKIGQITSGTYSPTLEKGIGLALVNQKFAVDSKVLIKIRQNLLAAKVVKRPFYKSEALTTVKDLVGA